MSIIAIVVIALVGLGIINSNKKNSDNKLDFSDNNSKFIIKENKTKTIKYTDFDNGLVKMKIPEGWKVDVLGDYIHYTIKAYDPQRPTYQFFFNMKTEGYNKSQEAKAFQQKYYPDSLFAKTSVIEGKNTEGFYKIFNDLLKWEKMNYLYQSALKSAGDNPNEAIQAAIDEIAETKEKVELELQRSQILLSASYSN